MKPELKVLRMFGRKNVEIELIETPASRYFVAVKTYTSDNSYEYFHMPLSDSVHAATVQFNAQVTLVENRLDISEGLV